MIETRDLKTPLHFGMGNTTMYNWINEMIEKFGPTNT